MIDPMKRDREHRDAGSQCGGGMGVAQVVEMAERLDADACPGGFPVAEGEAAEGDVPAREFRNSLAAVMASERAVPRMEPCQAELAMRVAISRGFSPVVGEVAVAAPRNPGAR
jgi:hypothetical protein